jgi:hypothetical protein
MKAIDRRLMWHGMFLFLLGLITGLVEQSRSRCDGRRALAGVNKSEESFNNSVHRWHRGPVDGTAVLRPPAPPLSPLLPRGTAI